MLPVSNNCILNVCFVFIVANITLVFTTRGGSGYAIGVLVAIFLSNGAYDIGWTPLWAYPAETLSYDIRARGVTLQTGVMHAFGFFGTFVNPIGLQNAGWKYYIAYIVYTFLEVNLIHKIFSPYISTPTNTFDQLLVVWYFFVETKGFTLEEIAVIFDTEGLTWKERRNMKPSAGSLEALAASDGGGSVAKDATEVSAKRVSDENI